MTEQNYLVQRGSLDIVLAELIEKQKTVISDIENILPIIKDNDIEASMLQKKKLAEEQLKALEAGYIPIVGGFFWDIDTKSKWGARVVRGILETAPQEVKEAIEQAKESKVFNKIKVSGARRGDPMLVGTAGKRNFLLAIWANLDGNLSIGFVSNLRKRIS